MFFAAAENASFDFQVLSSRLRTFSTSAHMLGSSLHCFLFPTTFTYAIAVVILNRLKRITALVAQQRAAVATFIVITLSHAAWRAMSVVASNQANEPTIMRASALKSRKFARVRGYDLLSLSSTSYVRVREDS